MTKKYKMIHHLKPIKPSSIPGFYGPQKNTQSNHSGFFLGPRTNKALLSLIFIAFSLISIQAVSALCASDSECGTDSVVNSGFCLYGDVYQTIKEYTCMNAGTTSSYCTFQNTQSLIQDCRFGCLGKNCWGENIACSSNTQCDDQNPQTQDICINAGTTSSYCTNNLFQCISDIQCGFPTSQRTCMENSVFNIITTPVCILNSCTTQTNNVQIEQCSYLCENNICINDSLPPEEAVCGNQIIEGFEQCDDGNTQSGDGCSAHCLIESPFCREVCSISGSAINFELSIDRSGSMNRYLEPKEGNIFQKFTKISAVREAARFLIINAIAANPQTLIGISTFSTDVVNNNDLTNNLEQLTNTVTYLYANGNSDTNYNESITYAVDKVLSHGQQNSANLIIFLSDGQPTVTNSKDTSGAITDAEDIRSALDSANYANEKGVTLVTVGFGKRTEINETLLAEMAARTNGRYFFVDSYEDITNLYEAIGEDTCQMICENPTCTYNSDCDDGDSSTIDTCINPGTLQSYCLYSTTQCTTNSQCGVPLTQRICSGNNVIDRTITPLCLLNSCTSTIDENIIQTCTKGCSNGACNDCIPYIPICNLIGCGTVNDGCGGTVTCGCSPGQTCSNGVCINPHQCNQDIDCNDNNASTIDRCVNNQCISLPPFCSQNTDCGIDGFIGAGFCSSNDVYGLFLNFICSNNQCSYSTNNLLLTDCLYGCTNGLCNTEPLPPCAQGYTQCADGICRVDCGTNFVCDNDNICDNNEGCECSDCYGFNDNCASGLVCNPDTEVCSLCPTGTVYNPLTERCVILGGCNDDADCDDENPNTLDECVNNNCINTPLACTQNSDCGNDGFIGNNFCLSNDVYGLFIDFSCSSNQCLYSINNLLVTDCLYGCNNGACITAPPIACNNNIDCNDNNVRTIDECINPGQTNSYCINTEVDCIINSDCGTTGFIDNNFCFDSDIYRLFQTATCENPGTLQSNCIIIVEQTLITDCNDNNPLTFDWCTNAQCSHTYPQCSDGLDNDGDGFVDYPSDPGCSSQLDDSESPYNSAQCSDGLDNDGDGFVDYPSDPGCINRFDNSESPYNLPQCDDGLDNDGDGHVDYPNDAGCTSRLDNSE